MLSAIGVAALFLTVAKTLPAQMWWPGWATVGAWWVTWWPVVTAVVVVIALFAGQKRLTRRAIEPESAQWVRRPDGTGWVRAATVGTDDTATGNQSRLRGVDWSKLTSAVTAFTALAALVFTSQSLAATRDQINVAEQGQITDRYTAAVNQISLSGADHLETRLGGIYALERIAIDSPRDQPTIIEVLSAFVRTNAPLPAGDGNQTCAPVALDVQAALTVLMRRNPAHDTYARVDFSHSCLTGANLTSTNGTDADLTGANLTGADLDHVDLTGANLTSANLTGRADLTDANLVGADLDYADLTGANLYDADLTGHAKLKQANLTSADLDHANLTSADLDRANFTGAFLIYTNVTGANVIGVTLIGATLTHIIGLRGH